VLDYNASQLGTLASPYVSPYVYNKQPPFLDRQYGVRKLADQFKIGNSVFWVDTEGNIHIGEPDSANKFNATPGLWELLTRKEVDKLLFTQSDLQTYKNILELSNAHLKGYEPGADIQISEGVKYRDVISKLFSITPARRAVKRQPWVFY
jgi:hypothetical protein